MHAGYDVIAIDENFLAGRDSKSDMENCAVFGKVDLLPGEHGLGTTLEVDLFSEGGKQLQGFVGNAVFGVVEQQAFGLQGVTGSATGILCKEIFQGCRFHLGCVGLQGLP